MTILNTYINIDSALCPSKVWWGVCISLASTRCHSICSFSHALTNAFHGVPTIPWGFIPLSYFLPQSIHVQLEKVLLSILLFFPSRNGK